MPSTCPHTIPWLWYWVLALFSCYRSLPDSWTYQQSPCKSRWGHAWAFFFPCLLGERWWWWFWKEKQWCCWDVPPVGQFHLHVRSLWILRGECGKRICLTIKEDFSLSRSLFHLTEVTSISQEFPDNNLHLTRHPQFHILVFRPQAQSDRSQDKSLKSRCQC